MLSVARRPGDLYTPLGSAFWEEVGGCVMKAGQLRRLAGSQISLRKETCGSWQSLPLETFVFLDQLKVSLNPWREVLPLSMKTQLKEFRCFLPHWRGSPEVSRLPRWLTGSPRSPLLPSSLQIQLISSPGSAGFLLLCAWSRGHFCNPGHPGQIG